MMGEALKENDYTCTLLQAKLEGVVCVISGIYSRHCVD